MKTIKPLNINMNFCSLSFTPCPLPNHTYLNKPGTDGFLISNSLKAFRSLTDCSFKWIGLLLFLIVGDILILIGLAVEALPPMLTCVLTLPPGNLFISVLTCPIVKAVFIFISHFTQKIRSRERSFVISLP